MIMLHQYTYRIEFGPDKHNDIQEDNRDGENTIKEPLHKFKSGL